MSNNPIDCLVALLMNSGALMIVLIGEIGSQHDSPASLVVNIVLMVEGSNLVP